MAPDRDPNTDAAILNTNAAILTEDEAAALLRTTPTHVRHLATTGKLPHVRVGRFVRYARTDLETFINDARVLPSGGAA